MRGIAMIVPRDREARVRSPCPDPFDALSSLRRHIVTIRLAGMFPRATAPSIWHLMTGMVCDRFLRL